MEIVQLNGETLTEQAYRVLLDAFISRRIHPGQRLKLEDLAAQMGTSPTPLRHALARLEAEGIINSQARRGLYVVSLAPKEVESLYEVRLMCESFATEKAVAAITDAQLDRMRQIEDEHVVLVNDDSHSGALPWAKKDVEFHQFIVDLAENDRISAWFRAQDVALRTLLQAGTTIRPPREAISEHRAIITAFGTRDPKQAKTAVVAHISTSRAFVLRSLDA